MPCDFQRCLESVKTLITEWCSEARPSRRFSTNLFHKKIISEIIRLWHSSFFSKFSKFHAHFRNGIKNLEKVFRFSDNSVWSCGRIFCIMRQEYLSSAINVLANSLKIYDQSKGVFFLLNLPGIHGKKRIMVMPCYFQRCLEPLNTLIT